MFIHIMNDEEYLYDLLRYKVLILILRENNQVYFLLGQEQITLS